MTRWLALLLLALLPVGAAQASPSFGNPPPTVNCFGEGAGRRCMGSVIQRFADNRGGISELTITAVRDPQCTTLHIVFDAPIALDRPAILTVEGAPTQRFYTPAELATLTRALDEGATAAAAPEFTRFLSQVSSGAIAETEAAREMLKRFAAVKEPRRLGLTCGPMDGLLAPIRAGHATRLEFSIAPRGVTEVYHWAQLDRRAVDLSLDPLLTALDRAMPGS